MFDCLILCLSQIETMCTLSVEGVSCLFQFFLFWAFPSLLEDELFVVLWTDILAFSL